MWWGLGRRPEAASLFDIKGPLGRGFQPRTLPRRSTLTTASRMTAPPNDSSKDGKLKSRWLIVAMPK